MKRCTLALMALLLAVPATPRAQGAGGEAKPAAAGASEGDAAKKTPVRRRAKAKEDPKGPSAAARSLARRTKSVFIYAAESCTRDPKGCDATLREDAEQRFLEACGRCTTTARCEAERDAIAAGTARASQDPCAP